MANARIEFWKAKLIDLSLRNKLLNYRPGRSSAVPVVDEVPRVVVDRLLARNQGFGFLPKPEEGPAPEGENEFRPLTDEQLLPRHVDGKLQTTLTRRGLEKTLYNLYLKSRTSFEEQGVVSLFLAVGMLRWFEGPESKESHLAPILLVPAILSRAGAGRPFAVHAAPVDPEVNPSLLRKLEVDFGVEPDLPVVDESLDPDALLESFRRASPDPRWQVLSDLHLSLFSFSKYIMYRDLEDQADVLLVNPLVARLAGEPVPTGEGDGELPDPRELDELRGPHEIHQILDADSSQQVAIEAVRLRKNLVLQGPPGTGKSQTIANVIAEFLADGRSVLFVSVKMAALEVVKRRLDQAALGDYVLELHSRHTAKREVVRELERCLGRDRQAEPPDAPELARLPEARAALDAYVHAVHEPFGAGGLTPYAALGVLARLADCRDVLFEMEEPEALPLEDRDLRLRLLADLARARAAVAPREEHPWRFSTLTSVPRTVKVELDRALGSLGDGAGRLASICRARSGKLGIDSPENLRAADRLAAILAHLGRSPRPEPSWVLDIAWPGSASEGRALAEKVRKRAEGRAALLEVYLEALFDLALDDLAARRRRHGTGLPRFLRPSWWSDRKILRAVRRPGARRRAREEIEDLELAVRVRDLGEDLEGHDDRGREIFGRFWKGCDSDWEEILALGEWVTRLSKLVPTSPPPRPLAEAAADPTALEGSAPELAHALARVREDLSRIEALLQAERTPEEIDELGPWTEEALDRGGEIHDWAAYRRALADCEAADLGRYLEVAEREGVAEDEIVSCYEKAFHGLFLDRTGEERPALRTFDRRRHEAAIRRFRELDEKQLRLAAGRIRGRLDADLPSSRSFSPESDVGLLLREAAKRRRHMPIRKLLRRAGTAVRRLKPCFMMSPLSVAQYLPPSSEPFDLIIFDEASQICPEDAVGAIARGRQMLVVGDSKQLPPTSFFAYDPDIEEEEGEEEPPPDLESILDLCATSGFPGLGLRFHYRSRDESLIAFSNRHFYDGSLITFPAPGRRRGLGVRFLHVEDGVYDRGRTRTNRLEAQAVARGIAGHIAAHPELSVGAVTFSGAQQRAVLLELERLRKADRRLDEMWRSRPEEPPFVKNLENVQGDERDVMFFSVGYARDEAGKLTMNFGPLNGEGGHRRLNVAVTRARRAVRVYASIVPEDIDPDRATGRGARLLRSYLEYARQGPDTTRERAGDEAFLDEETPFETAVAHTIEAEGFLVTQRVGASAFRLDLALSRPGAPERYLLGIQCDGATYRDAATTRDRDRTRPLVLDRLGWNLMRVWSADWVRSPRREVDRLLERIDVEPAPDSGAPAPSPPSPASGGEEDGEGETREPAETDLPGAATYRVTPMSHRNTRKQFEERSPDLLRFVTAVVRFEGPIHEDLLARRIAETYRTRTTRKVRDATGAAIDVAEREGGLERRGEFLWPPGRTDCPIRAPARGERPRKIEHVPDEEIADGIRTVLDVDLRLPRASLMRAVAGLLGRRRPGDQVLARIGECLTALAARGEVELNDLHATLPGPRPERR